MLRKWNRFLAILLAFALVTTTFNSDFASVRVYADGEEAEEFVEEQEESSGEDDSEEGSEEDNSEEESHEDGDEGSGDDAQEQSEEQNEEQNEEPETPDPIAENEEVAEATAEIATEEPKEEPKEEKKEEVPAATETTAAATESSSLLEPIPEEAAVAASSLASVEEEEEEEEEKEENLVTVKYYVTEGGSISKDEETVDLNDEEAKFEGSTATADSEEYEFKGWKDSDGTIVTTDNTIVPENIEEDTSFTAVFEKAEKIEEKIVVITYEAGEGGKVSPEKEEININAEEIIIKGSTATADEGYEFVEWKDSENNTVSDSTTFIPSGVEKDTIFKAFFKEKKIEMPAMTLTKSAGRANVFIDAPEGAFPEGTTIEVTAIEDGGVLDRVKETVENELNSDESEAVKTVDDVVAVDITFYYEGEEIYPSIPITVKITSSVIENAENAQVVHVDDGGSASIVENAQVDGSVAEFETADFSIYAIATVSTEDIEVIRRTYKFQDADGTPYLFPNSAGEEVDNQIIKNGEALVEVESPYHPEKEFIGWYIYENDSYGEQIQFGQSIDLSALTADDEVILRAKYNNHYIVTFLDENRAVIASEEVTNEEGTFTINTPYEPKNPETSAFLGWKLDNPEQQSKIEVIDIEGTLGEYYTNGMKVKITDNITFKVYNPEGHWLIFHENAKGAQYTPSVFIENDKITVEPTAPKRLGYTHDGWYTEAPLVEGGDPTGEKFVFGSTIDKTVNLYAKWKPNDTAKYTVIIWKYDLEGNKEYAESVTVENGVVGQPVSGIEIDEDDCSITINGEKYGGPSKIKEADDDDPNLKYVGFKPVSYDEGVIVNPEGNSIVNVYFDRITYDFEFILAHNIGGNWRQYTDGKRSHWTGNLDISESDVPGATNNGSYIYFTISAKYGENISDKWPNYSLFSAIEAKNSYELVSWILDSNAMGYTSGDNNGGETVKGKITTMDENILGNWKSSTGNFVDARFSNVTPYSYTYYICVEKANSQGTSADNTLESQYDSVETIVYNGVEYELLEKVPSKSNSDFGGQKAPGYVGFTALRGSDDKFIYTQLYSRDNRERGLAFYYKRNAASINYMDGAYKDGDGNVVDGIAVGAQIKEISNITFGTDLSSYNKGGANYYDPSKDSSFTPYDGFIFSGWYKDKDCTDPYTFTTLGNDSITVYAKWTLKQYRVFLHPNAYEDDGTTLKAGYAIGNQSTSFRVDYGEKVTPTSPKSDDYEFVGWYRDPEFKTAFSTEATALNDTTVTAAYDKTESTERDQYDKVTEDKNTDIARPWIERKLDLYAKWRSTLTGANGIGVEYIIDEDLTAVTDSKIYADNSAAVAKNCPDDKVPEGMKFAHWVVQKWNGQEYVDSAITVGAEKSYTVYKSYAKQTEDADSTPDDPKYTYTVRLKAVFKENKDDNVILTKIVYNGNGGTTSLVSSEADNLVVSDDSTTATYSKLQINAALAITDQSFTRLGYEFLGWANENPDAETPDYKVGDKVGVDELNPTSNTLYAVWKLAPIDVTVTIKGKQGTNVYDGESHTTTGYKVEISDSRYTESKIEFSGSATATRTEVGTTYMELSAGQFTNTDAGFNVTFVVAEDGYQEITPITDKITVKITGHNGSFDYDGTEHEVTGYDVTSISNPLYTANDFSFSGSATAKRIIAGTTIMGLVETQFANTNTKFTNVEFIVDDGYVEIKPISVTVTIEGRKDSEVYDGAAHTVTGYDVTGISNPLYTANDFTFSGAATATRTEVGTTYMGLTAAQFTNTNTNFKDVTFEVTDGEMEITPVTEKVTVTITGNTLTKPYNGSKQEVTGYTFSCKNTLYTEDSIEFTGTAKADGTDAATYQMGLAIAQFSNTNRNFTNVEFVVNDGWIKITPITAKVTITGNHNAVTYDGEEHEVSGFESITYSTTLYKRSDFRFDGTAEAKRTEAGTTDMKLKPEMFVNLNTKNFETVEFEVIDGYITIVPSGEVVVTVTGNHGTFDYDGNEHEVTGYEFTASDPLYTEKDFTFEGNDSVTRIDAGTGFMGLKEEDFTDISENFEKVTFVVTDGYITINPIAVTVTITGNNNTYVYNGSEQAAEGYEAEADNELYSVDSVIYNGNAIAQRTDVGTTPMNLDVGLFENTDTNFNDVTFVIEKDGSVTITPLEIVITVTGNTKEETYDGKEKEVTGYTAKADNDLYQISKINMTGQALAKGTLVGTYNMGLKAEQFTNTDENFKATFEIVDGYLTIKGRGEGEKFLVTLITDDVERPYTGQVYSGFGYHAEGGKSVKAAAAALNRVVDFISGIITPISAGAADGTTSDPDITIDGVTYKVTGLSVDVAERDAGKYPLTISGDMVILDEAGNDVTDQFAEATKKEGTLTITPMPITVTSGSSSKTYDGTALTNSEITTDRAWGEGDAVEYNITGRQIEVGESDNTFDVIGTGNTDLEKNYIVTRVYGKLTVSDAVVPPTPTPDPDPTPGGDDTPTGGDDTPTAIDDTPTPTAPTPAPLLTGTPDPAVLGAQRAANQAAVLGSRRAKTEDSTNDVARLFAIIIAAAVAITLMATKRRKEEE